MSKTHELKLDPVMYDLVLSGDKTFEYRKNDRDFKKGDVIVLREFDRETQEYSGRYTAFIAGFVLYGPDYGVPEGNCIISMFWDTGNRLADLVEATKCLRQV